jgi:hypothetical protein
MLVKMGIAQLQSASGGVGTGAVRRGVESFAALSSGLEQSGRNEKGQTRISPTIF